jgi:hypothetical protein
MPFRLTPVRALVAAVVLLGSVACNPPAPKTVPKPAAVGGYPFQSATFSSRLRWETGSSLSSRYWISPLGLLKEMTNEGKVSFLLLSGGNAYQWDATSKEGKKGVFSGGPRVTGEPDALEVLRVLPEMFKAGKFQFAGYETIEGVRTVKYAFRFRDEMLRAVWEGMVWLREDRPFPVKYVNRGFGGHFEILNSKMVFDAALDPGFFRPPSDVHFVSADIHRKPSEQEKAPPRGGAGNRR